MKILLLLLLVLFSTYCQAQTIPNNLSDIQSSCCSQYRASCGSPTPAKTLVDYLLGDSLLDKGLREQHISNRNQLEAFQPLVRTEELVYLQSGATTLFIQKESIVPIEVYELDFFSFAEEEWEELDSTIETINGKKPLGWRGVNEGCSRSLVPRIKSLSLNGNSIDTSPFNHLLFPNFTATYFSLQPIAAYWSPDHQFIYLYVFGAPVGDATDFYYNARKTSYMAKVVINLSKGKIEGILAVKGFVLNRYDWFCEGFVGF